MSGVMESVDVGVPVRTAYDQWTQFEEFPRFMEGVAEVRQVSDTMTHWVIDVAGQQREFDARITEQHPDERVAWASTDGPHHSGVVTFHRIDDDRSRVTVQLEVDPQGAMETAADASGMLRRRVKGDLKRFKQFIEARGQETGAWRGEVARPEP